jgi:UDP-N-acetylmuramoyl-tripeptide--D-alanyl-D-alanine ligase
LKTVSYGAPGYGFDIEGEVVECNPCVVLRWRVKGAEWDVVQTQLVGAYNANNMLAAAAVGIRFGVSEEAICAALADYAPSNKRSELQHTPHNTLIVDAYNANPTSMRAAIENFRLIPHEQKLLILGDMRELGAASQAEHEAVLALLREADFSRVWTVGPNFKDAGAEAAGYRCFADVDAVIAELRQCPLHEHLVLIKGSNGTRLYLLPPHL